MTLARIMNMFVKVVKAPLRITGCPFTYSVSSSWGDSTDTSPVFSLTLLTLSLAELNAVSVTSTLPRSDTSELSCSISGATSLVAILSQGRGKREGKKRGSETFLIKPILSVTWKRRHINRTGLSSYISNLVNS